jgi:hypothetical protein
MFLKGFAQAFGVKVFDFIFYHLSFFEERKMVEGDIKDFYPECFHKNGTLIMGSAVFLQASLGVGWGYFEMVKTKIRVRRQRPPPPCFSQHSRHFTFIYVE